MSIVILRGEEAIHYANAHGVPLHSEQVGSEPARDGLSVDEARKIQQKTPGHIWLETEIGINSGETLNH